MAVGDCLTNFNSRKFIQGIVATKCPSHRSELVVVVGVETYVPLSPTHLDFFLFALLSMVNSTEGELQGLPYEILNHIFTYLTLTHLHTLSTSSRSFYTLIKLSSPQIWKRAYFSRWRILVGEPHKTEGHESGKGRGGADGWAKAYRKRLHEEQKVGRGSWTDKCTEHKAHAEHLIVIFFSIFFF